MDNLILECDLICLMNDLLPATTWFIYQVYIDQPHMYYKIIAKEYFLSAMLIDLHVSVLFDELI